MNHDSLKFATIRHTEITSLIDKCFAYDIRENNLNLREYIDEYEFVMFNGVRVGPNTLFVRQRESVEVPDKYLIQWVELHDSIEDAKAWLRAWSLRCDELTDFISGLPGNSNKFIHKSNKELWSVMKQGSAFDDLESRVFAYKLLKGEM